MSKQSSLSVGAVAEVLDAFRLLQRCRDKADDRFYVAERVFNQRITEICTAHDHLAAINDVISYFKENWFCDEWRGAYLKY